MSTIMIAENILDADDFSAATEQEGKHVGQPVPDSGNAGSFRLLSKGDIKDFSYDGTATGDGNVGGTTVIDSVLSAFGDDYFISGTVKITSGPANGITRTVSDFVASTGTITVSASFSEQILTGVTFTLTVAFASRDFRVEIDTFAGTVLNFKWSHDGGTTYLSRDNPDAATWLGQTEVAASTAGGRCRILQANNGDLLAFFADEALNTSVKKSTDNGLTWGADVFEKSTTAQFVAAVKLGSGRILVYNSNPSRWGYSDDNGDNWSTLKVSGMETPDDVKELESGQIVSVYDDVGAVLFQKSEDGGVTWFAGIIVAADANDQLNPSIAECNGGTLVCVYKTDEDSIGDVEIKCKRSTDGGATWGSVIAVMDFVANDYEDPHVIKDINGDLYCCATVNGDIVFTVSDDNGETWGAEKTLLAGGGNTLQAAGLGIVDGHQIFCIFYDDTNNKIYTVRRGIWETLQIISTPPALNGIAQHLICGVDIVWRGGSGILGDKWIIAPAYHYAMSNLIEDSPSFPWRSKQDGIVCTIVIDMGVNNRFAASGVAFFGCNVRSFDFQMNATDSWESPSVDQSISFDLTSGGVVDSVSGNVLVDAALMADYKDHALRGTFLRMLDGTDSGVTWKILDNVGDNIVLDTTAAHNVAGADTFAIFQSSVAKTFTEGVYRFIRINIGSQETSDDYYQIGSMVAGKAITLDRTWTNAYQQDHQYNIEQLRTLGGGIVSIKRSPNVRKRLFTVTWPAAVAVRLEVAALLDYVEGKNIALIPDNATMTDCYLTKLVGDMRQSHRALTQFDVTATFEEIL